MLKAMIFIDGTWLYSNVARLGEAYGKPDFHLDFGKLPRVLGEEISRQLGGAPVDLIRTHLFGSYASNYDLRDEDAVQSRLDFFSMLKEEYHYEVEIFPINFRGRRLRREDRDPNDPFEPKEKCVDISLATFMLYNAAIPYAYDVAIAVVGDQDFKPVLQHVRLLGKRVAIASVKGSCAPEFADPSDPARVKDFDVVWLDELVARVELKYDPHQLLCESPIHRGDRKVWTTFHPRKGQRFFCDACRAEFTRQKQEAQQRFVSDEIGGSGNGEAVPLPEAGRRIAGEIKRKISDRGYGFIHAADGRDYFFHLTDLEPGLEFAEVLEGLQVDFEVKREPSLEKSGAAQNVRRRVVQT